MSAKPTLSLSTPKTANFPHIPPPSTELRSAVSLPSAISDRTPLSAISRTSAFRDPIPLSALPSAGLPSAGPFSATVKLEQDLQKTPITPPTAYLDFLKGMSLVSPSVATASPQIGKAALNRNSTASSLLSNSSISTADSISSNSSGSEDSDKEKGEGEPIDSAPSTARSELSCECDDKDKEGHDKEEHKKGSIPEPINTSKIPSTPEGSKYPLSAPAMASMFPSMKLPASPAISTSGVYSPRSPLNSAASIRSPFDWDAARRSKRPGETAGTKRQAAPDTPTSNLGPGHVKRDSRSNIRYIREVVTRTVTYTPRMAPAPKGKRRKIDTETAVDS
ncbi:hypothetical protein B0T17DRAFT_620382 [Bombardia bombarda]|uniref:Uncharacterized protein n=1 Tax=Bombardia bombarda TaxID=252184 RepID=A0AA39WD44_9PEZI|nr:hypothetical protein B0T17DRAFT_620382 [Bombardia bombarda]